MLIVFGWEKSGKRIRPLLDTHCYQCKRVSTWDWNRITQWVSLFFIRVLPFKSVDYLSCPGCGDAIELDPEERRGLGQFDRLSREASQALHDKLVTRLEEHQFAGKSATQREFIKSSLRRSGDG
jgi:hypothetical protein